MDVKYYHLKSIICILALSLIDCSSISKNISNTIFEGYDSGLRPVCANVPLVNMTMGIAVRQVIGLDEPNQIVRLNLWMRLKWNDCFLTWNPNDYGGLDNIIVPIKRVWVPDLTLYDSTATEFSGIKEYRAHIFSDGSVYYNFPTVLEALCPIEVLNFPFDTQICALVFGSWNHHGLEIDFYPKDNPGDLSTLKSNVEWLVPKVAAKRHSIKYTCCPAPYPDVTFYVYLERKPGYYIINILIPSVMITVLAILGYFLPVDSGEKVSLVITVMLAMSVFQLLVADKLPPSAESTPWIMFFFNFILGLSAVSTILQVLVINLYYRGEREIPTSLKDYVIKPLCFITCVPIPGEDPPSYCRRKIQCSDFTKPQESTNTVMWQSFSIAVDRLGIVLFSFTLVIGIATVFRQMTGSF
ncbi:neuronal acetylcholine receptor subunit alpha-10-like [Mytilus trossulus]|uniref:neuronal acetylcholine receptor subunit alpha-10-like n=1 Tax=Mytilus trossulus TaxID=6551 RepID=UPI0030069B7B